MSDKIDKPVTVKAAPKPTRVELEHPKMKGRARVWERDIAAWLGKGWQRVKSAGNAD